MSDDETLARAHLFFDSDGEEGADDERNRPTRLVSTASDIGGWGEALDDIDSDDCVEDVVDIRAASTDAGQWACALDDIESQVVAEEGECVAQWTTELGVVVADEASLDVDMRSVADPDELERGPLPPDNGAVPEEQIVLGGAPTDGNSTPHQQLAPQAQANVGVLEQLAASRLLVQWPTRPPDCNPLSVALRAVEQQRHSPTDAEVTRIADSLLTSTAVASVASRADKCDASEYKLQRWEARLASCLDLAERWIRQCMEYTLLSGPASGTRYVMAIELAMYDETPLTVRLRDLAFAITADGKVASTAGEILEAGGSLPSALGKEAWDTVVGKLMQSEDGFSYLMQLQGDRCVCIRGSSSNPYKLVDGCTGEVIAKIGNDFARFTSMVEKFEYKLRLACTDGFKANYRGEQAIVSQRNRDNPGPRKWNLLHLTCLVHKVAGVHSHAFDLYRLTMSGFIHSALGVKANSGAISSFRKIVKTEIAHDIVWVFGEPAEAAQTYRDAVIRLYLSGASNLRRRAVFESTARGDWRRRGVIEVVVTLGVNEELEDTPQRRMAIASDLSRALLPSSPPTYNRSKWNGLDAAIDPWGLLEAFHGLIYTVVPKWLATYKEKDARNESEQAREEEAEHAVAVVLPIEGEADNAAATKLQSGGSHAKHNVNHRKATEDFVESGECRRLPLIRLVAEPLQTLLNKTMFRGGLRWEAEQRQIASRHDQRDGFPKRRAYKLAESAELRLENECISSLQELQTSSARWDAVNPISRTEAFQSDAFALTSRALCLVNDNIKELHKKGPFTLFSLLYHPEKVDEIKEKRACTWDLWSADYLESRRDRLDDDLTRAELALIALTCQEDIASLEVGHGRFRRRLIAASTNTWRMTIEQANTGWVVKEHSNRRRRCDALAGKEVLGRHRDIEKKARKVRAKSAPPKLRADKRQAGGGGGGYRAFWRLCPDLVQGASLTERGKRYRELDDDRKMRCLQLGKDMTSAHRARREGGGDDRASDSTGDRTLQQRQQETEEQVDTLQDNNASLVPVGVSLGNELACRQVMDIAKNRALAQRRADKAQRTQIASDLNAFVTSNTSEVCEQLCTVSQLTHGHTCMGDFTAAPSDLEHMDCLIFNPDVSSLAKKLLERTAKHPRIYEKFHKELEDHWQKVNDTLCSKDCVLIQDKTQQPSLCFQAGMCLCQGRGLLVKACAKEYTTVCKHEFREGHRHKMFLGSRIALRLSVGRHLDSEDQDNQDAEQSEKPADIYWHVGAVSLKPYGIPVQALHFQRQSGERIILEATGEPLSMYIALASALDLDWEYTMQLYSLTESSAILPHIRPATVILEPFPKVDGGSYEPVGFWPHAPKYPKRPRKNSQRPRGGNRGGGAGRGGRQSRGRGRGTGRFAAIEDGPGADCPDAVSDISDVEPGEDGVPQDDDDGQQEMEELLLALQEAGDDEGNDEGDQDDGSIDGGGGEGGGSPVPEPDNDDGGDNTDDASDGTPSIAPAKSSSSSSSQESPRLRQPRTKLPRCLFVHHTLPFEAFFGMCVCLIWACKMSKKKVCRNTGVNTNASAYLDEYIITPISFSIAVHTPKPTHKSMCRHIQHIIVHS